MAIKRRILCKMKRVLQFINLSSDNVSKVALLPLSEAAAKVEICFVGGDGRISNKEKLLK